VCIYYVAEYDDVYFCHELDTCTQQDDEAIDLGYRLDLRVCVCIYLFVYNVAEYNKLYSLVTNLVYICIPKYDDVYIFIMCLNMTSFFLVTKLVCVYVHNVAKYNELYSRHELGVYIYTQI